MSTRVFFRTLDGDTPVYHHVPDWHAGEGRRGTEVVCNVIVRATDGSRVGGGNPLPASVVSPCGATVYRRRPPRNEPWEVPLITRHASTMVPQGDLIPLHHAEKFGRPCSRCYP